MSSETAEKTPSLARELTDINLEFLRLLTHPEAAGAPGLLGLEGSALSGLRRLGAVELERLATAPLLLAEFAVFPGQGEVREMPPLPDTHVPDSVIWQAEMTSFANRLMTCIWQAARHDPLLAALYMGISRRHCREISAQSFCAVSRYAGHAAEALRVRLSAHPRFWDDLVHFIRTGSPRQQLAARLSILQLSVAGARRLSASPLQPAYH